MTWVRRTESIPAGHVCPAPTRLATMTLPTSLCPPGQSKVLTLPATVVDGAYGDLWRCDECGRLWRVGADCDRCDRAVRERWGSCVPGRYHFVGLQWRPAYWWQRLRYRQREPAAPLGTAVDRDGANRP